MLNSGFTFMLLRHAKSRWDEEELSDHDRGLAPRGLRASQRIGVWLRSYDRAPSLVLCSSARRAQQTWRLVRQTARLNCPSKSLRSLYLAPPSRILAITECQERISNSIMVVAHNPGLHLLACRLLGEDTPGSLLANMPTAALLILERRNSDGAFRCNFKLIDYVVPRQLGYLDRLLPEGEAEER